MRTKTSGTGAVWLLLVVSLIAGSCGNHEPATLSDTTAKTVATTTAKNNTLMANAERKVLLHSGHPFSAMTERVRSVKGVVIPEGQTASDFLVQFTGIICHAKLDPRGGDDTPRRSIVVDGRGMGHQALLIVDDTVDTAQLLKATGNTPDCSGSVFINKCTVDITGVDIRIRGNSGSVATGTLHYDAMRSFECLPPKLKTVAVGGSSSSSSDIPLALLKPVPALPSGVVAAFFEIDGGGLLAACPFDDGGQYEDDAACHQFASDVYWSGSTTGPATLELRSPKTPNMDWMPIDVHNSGTLKLLIRNEPPVGASATSAHFVLFNNILSGARVPNITRLCPLKAEEKCVICEDTDIVSIPGCSDSQWP